MKKAILFIPIVLFAVTVVLGLIAPRPETSPAPSDASTLKSDTLITVLDCQSGTTSTVELEEYLFGVLAAEMPASYEPEALKAQAVAARSYILSKINTAPDGHRNADICNNPSHCKAHIDEAAARERWGNDRAEEYTAKILSAVSSTCGEYMVYDGEIVEAFFFAKSSGRTENSEDVWGESRPYLRSVSSEGDLLAPDLYSTAEFTLADFRQRLATLRSDLPKGNTPPTIGKAVRTVGGNVGSISIDGSTFKGTELRAAFGLKSACFDISVGNGTVTFTVAGYGHGVGMSQYGANLMAKNGKNYTEILSHYYTNIQIMKL